MPRQKTKIVASTQSEEVLETVLEEETEEVEVEVKPKAPVKLPEVKSAKIPLTGKAMQMKAKLDAQPKVMVFVPLAAGEKLGVTQPVTLNGYPLFIPKGVGIEVPLSVKEVIDIKLKQQNAVFNHPLNITGARKEVPLTQYGG